MCSGIKQRVIANILAARKEFAGKAQMPDVLRRLSVFTDSISMKLYQVILIFLIMGFASCQNSNNKIIIQGEITGKIPDKVDYTNPIHGVCNWAFTKSVVPDESGKFQIEIESKSAIFIKIRASYSEKGIIIAEPGQTYSIRFNVSDKDKPFEILDNSAILQQTYNKLPEPEHLQVAVREFLADTVPTKIREIVEQRKTAEIEEFEKMFAAKTISKEAFDLVQLDRNCYYNAVWATYVWLKKLIEQPEHANLLEKTLNQSLFSNLAIVKSPWFPSYAEIYIYLPEHIKGTLTKEKAEALINTGQVKTYQTTKAKEYLPPEIHEDYIAHFLYEESLQQSYEKELVELFDKFKTDYPQSEYTPSISPLVDEIVKFHKAADSAFNEKTKFVADYQNLNTLTEIAKALPAGKTYVDVWASWCGPCKEEFGHKEELKKLLQQYDIQMLYLSIDRDNDSIKWKNMIKFYKLEGFHVRANKALGSELRKLYDKGGSLGIPWYILMDSNGTVILKHASRPSQANWLEKDFQLK